MLAGSSARRPGAAQAQAFEPCLPPVPFARRRTFVVALDAAQSRVANSRG